MKEGNCLYDVSPATRGGHLLGVFDAVDLMPASTVQVAKELGFWNSNDCIGILRSLADETATDGILRAGVVVQTPYFVTIVLTPVG